MGIYDFNILVENDRYDRVLTKGNLSIQFRKAILSMHFIHYLPFGLKLNILLRAIKLLEFQAFWPARN